MGEKIACLPGMQYDIGFGNGAPRGRAPVIRRIIFEILFFKHGS
jgi:hypothetical protein